MATFLDLGDQTVKVQVGSADPVESRLQDLLQVVNEWLKFAEAKNGGAVGLGSGAVAILFGYLSEGGFGFVPGLFLVLGVICFVLSAVVGIASFSPRTDFLRLRAMRHGEPIRTDNLYYFGHLAKYSPRQLIDAIVDRYLDDDARANHDLKDVQMDIASQVTINARITMLKLRLFNVAVGAFGIGVVLCTVGATLHLT
jgi:hypothetical protein